MTRSDYLAGTSGRLQEHTGALRGALTEWAMRDGTTPQPAVRRAANTAMDAIDAMLGELHRARSTLVSQIQLFDAETLARTDAMLARLRHQRPGGRP